MAVTAACYGLAFKSAFNKEIDWDEATKIKVSLHTVTYVPDQDVDDYWDDATNEVSGTGYTTGGAEIGSLTSTYTAGTNKLKLDGADVTWSSSTITARIAVVYYNTGVSTTSPLICYQKSDADISSTAGDWKIVWHADGIVEITVGAEA